jgi:hypothetical protein
VFKRSHIFVRPQVTARKRVRTAPSRVTESTLACRSPFRRAALTAIVSGVAGLTFSASAQVSISRSVVASGGGTVSAGSITVTGTTGQPVTGVGCAASVCIHAGFWFEAGCSADVNGSNTVTVQDIYDFLADWTSQVNDGPLILGSADFNGAGGVTVQDIYDFLAAWNAGC